MPDLTLQHVGDALKGCGHYRVIRAQVVAQEGGPDGISGAVALALGLRETGLTNIEGGASWDKERKLWVASKDDTGCFQISRSNNPGALKRMPGVAAETWTPVVPGKTALDVGYCPRYEEALRYTVNELHEAMALAEQLGVHPDQQLQFAVAAHNAGQGGATKGFREGNIDAHTAHGDYGAWVLRHAKLIRQWLTQHDNWRVKT